MKTYFIDIDGTIVPHICNDDLTSGPQDLLPYVEELWKTFDEHDVIILTTARLEIHRELTVEMLKGNKLKYDLLLMNLPSGPRILINDTIDDTKKAIAINVKRDEGFEQFLKSNNLNA